METVSAAYLMGDAKFINNRLRVVGGVRFEKTQDKSQGRLVDPTRAYQKNAAGEVVLVNNRPVLLPEATTDAGRALLTNIARGTHTTRRYDGYYPSVNASFALTDNTVLRGSYSKTLARPQLSNILPNLSIALNPDGTETQRLTLNNTALKPWEANSFDASIEYYFQHAGVASVGFFYKDIQNYFGLVNSVATPDLLDQYGLSDNYLGYNVTTMYNLGPIILRGVELNYSQKLSFLPSIGRNFSVFANSTLMEASGFGYTVTDIGSAGITYASKKLKFSVKGTYTPQIKNDEPIAAGSPIYQYKMERLRTDVSLEYALSKRITAFINARDILRTTNTDERYAPSTPTYARFYQTYEYGAQFIVGLKGSFR